jgi:hypothetical protein
MGRNATAGTRQLVVDVDTALRGRLDERVKTEERTLRRVVERAIAYYLDNVPAEGVLASTAVPAKPRGKGK